MSAVFLSYAQTDRDLAGQVFRELKAAGVDVWRDEEMPGVDWRRALERQIGELGAIIALWTPASKEDSAVKDAARVGLSAGKLVNATVGALPPFPYGSADGAWLDGWAGAEDHAGWAKLVEMIQARASAEGGPVVIAADSTKNETPPGSSVGGAKIPEELPNASETPTGGEPSQIPGGGAQKPNDGADLEKARISKAWADYQTLWDQQHKPTLLGTIVRRLLAAGVAYAAVMVGLEIYRQFGRMPFNPPSPGEFTIPIGLLAFAGFLWKGWH